MKLSHAALLALFFAPGQAQFTWPSAYDELEDVMFLNTGYRSRGFGSFVTPCSASPFVGRQTAAEWLRAGFHDMATTNIYYATTASVHGGIDASLAFELNDGENVGAGFNSTFVTYGGFLNSRLPAADLVALGVYASVRSCGGPVVPMRGGRRDATIAGPLGVPQPQNGAGTFSNQFARMGFNNSAMIQMTACGHTLGGVHAGDFPQIVAPGTVANDFQLFDTTEGWDSLIASRYVNGPDTDPLAVGISVSSGRNADFAVFSIDKNVTIKSMTATDAFNSQCANILQEMIEVVDPTVSLSSIIVPYEVKPSGLQLTLLSGATQIQFSGYIRVRTTTRSAASITGVQLIYTDGNGNANAGTITATDAGSASGFDDSFEFYSFSANLPLASSISSFTVVVSSNGLTQTYSNGGNGFPVSDSVIVQMPQSCIANGHLTVVAAVRSTVTTPVNMTVTQKVAQNAGSPIPSPLPSLASSSVIMTQGAAVGPYTLYSASMGGVSSTGTKYGVSSGSFSDTFKDVSDLGAICASSPPGASSPSSTSSISTSTSTSTSSSVTPTLAVKPTVGAYTFQGCYTEGDGVRALRAASYYNYTGMTLEQCQSDCTGYNYWGVEYGGECYCGNTLADSSTLATLSDCSFVCPGNAYEYCGAGNRLELYLINSLASPTTSAASLSSTSTTATPTLGIRQTVGAYTFQGCWTEATNVRALSGAMYYDYDAMTLEECASDCAGWAYFGVEYGGECYCGTSPNAGSVSTTISDCSFICPGNQYEYCGAGDRLEMYMLSSLASTNSGSAISTSESSLTSSTSTTKSVTSTTKTSSSSKSSSSSLKSSTTTKASSTSASKSSTSSSKSSTTSKKSSSSSTSKSSTSSSKSSTSSSKSSTSSSKSSTSSSKSSTSSSKSSTTSIPSKIITSTTSSSSSSTTPTQTAPAIKPHIGNYTYYACMTEATDVRALNSAVLYNYTAMTLESCATYCNGYPYWGVEYGGECYCGNQFNTGSVNATESDCSFTCPGNDLEFCGAGNRLSSYYLSS